jgi:antitoxin component of MazEF toxin-antitoxin module
MERPLLTAKTKIQQNRTVLLSAIPNSVAKVLKAEKGNELEWEVYPDGSVKVKVLNSK